MSKKKCPTCNSYHSDTYKNKLCQKCFSKKIENQLIKNGKELLFTSEFLIEEYITKNKSIKKIALDNSDTQFKVRSHLTKYRIPLRSQKESLSKKINENILKKITAKSAFALGYIFTDGDLVLNKKYNKYFLQIYSKYLKQIENLKEILDSEAKIQTRKEKIYKGIVQGEMYWIYIGNQIIISDLIKLGMVLDKNQNIQFPDIPQNLKSHFIRGCWAGSGNVSYDKNNLRSSIVIGSFEFIAEIERHLNSMGLKKRNIYSNKYSKKTSYVMSYSTTESEKLYNYLYRGKTNLTICARQEKFYKDRFNFSQ